MDDLGRHCCQKPDCPDAAKRGHGNLSVTSRYGPGNAQIIREYSDRLDNKERMSRSASCLAFSFLFPSARPSATTHAANPCWQTVDRLLRQQAHASSRKFRSLTTSPAFPDAKNFSMGIGSLHASHSSSVISHTSKPCGCCHSLVKRLHDKVPEHDHVFMTTCGLLLVDFTRHLRGEGPLNRCCTASHLGR